MGRKGRSHKLKARVATAVAVKTPLKKVQVEGSLEPTREQMGRVEFTHAPVRNELGRTIGFAYRRNPLFETMAKTMSIAPPELEALRVYRAAFDRSHRSPTKSCLDFGGGGGGGGGSGRGIPSDIANATPTMIDAKRRLLECEATMGNNVQTMRAVVLHDMSFSQVAIDRFGHRIQHWIYVDGPGRERGEHHDKVVPKSGRHREAVRQEFLAGMRALSRALTTHMSDSFEIWVDRDDAAAWITVGRVAPDRRYRLWGSYDDVADVRFHIQQGNPDMRYANAADARAALDVANQMSRTKLRRLEDEELKD